MRRSIAAGLALMGPLALAAAAPAGQNFDSRVTIEYVSTASKFAGEVKSDKGGCEPRRAVTLYYKHAQKQPKVVVGEDTTNGQGEWSVDDPIAGSETYYFAKVKARSIDAGRCKADESKTLVNPGG